MNLNRLRFQFLLLIFFALGATSCVSVKIQSGSDVEKSKVIEFLPPPTPFKHTKNETVDEYWKNFKNGNSISFLSECSSPGSADPSLDAIYKGLISSIDQAKALELKKINYNGREALQTVTTGTVDGIQSKFKIILLKKNNCNYIVSYIATEKMFAQNEKDFDEFLKGFRVK